MWQRGRVCREGKDVMFTQLLRVMGVATCSLLVVAAVSLPVRALATLPGDYNGNGVVDTADFSVWRSCEGKSGANLPADGNGDGIVDQSDRDLWRAHYGESGALSAVPEAPAIVVWAGVVLVGIGIVAYYRHRSAAVVSNQLTPT